VTRKRCFDPAVSGDESLELGGELKQVKEIVGRPVEGVPPPETHDHLFPSNCSTCTMFAGLIPKGEATVTQLRASHSLKLHGSYAHTCSGMKTSES